MEKLVIGELQTIPYDWGKLSYVAENNVVKKCMFDKQVEKFNAIQTTDTIDLLKKLNTTQKFKKLKKKIPNHDTVLM